MVLAHEKLVEHFNIKCSRWNHAKVLRKQLK